MATIAFEQNIIDNYSSHKQYSRNHNVAPIRRLETGDFDEVNQLFNGTIVTLPDTDFNQGGLQLGLRSLECKELVIGDITTDWNVYNSSSVDVSTGYAETLGLEVAVAPFSLTCSADYSWELTQIGFVRGSGNLVAISTNSSAKFRIDFNSELGFQNDFPSNIDFQTCEATINIDDINFQGGLIGEILSLAENLISNFVEDQVKKLICDKLIEAGPPAFNKFFNRTSSKINEWMKPVPSELADPLYFERNVFSTNQTLVNFKNGTNDSSAVDGSLSNLVPFVLNQVSSFLGRKTTDSDLYFNILLRKTNILDENGALEFKFDGSDKIPAFQTDPVLFSAENPIQIDIKMNGVRVTGLDNATNITAMNPIGAQTLQNLLSWDALDFEFDLSVSLKPSASPEALFYNPEPREVFENISVSLTFYDITAEASLFLAIDTNKLDSLQLGSLMRINNIFPCILETVEAVQVTGLEASFSNYTKPILSGFESPGLERLAISAMDAALVAFEPTVQQSFPNILQGLVRKALNDRVLPSLTENRTCPTAATQLNDTSLIDLRDLILPESESKQAGGTGNSQYGNLFPSLYKIIQDEFLSNETKLIQSINDQLSSFTSSKSGTAGGWLLQKDLLNVDNRIHAGGLDARIQLRAYDAYIKNLNTVGSPLTVLEPVDATLLNSSATIGEQNPLSLGMSLIVALSTGNVNISNDLEISIGLDQLQLLATAVLKLSAKELLEFPMRDILNLNCWLATIPAPQLDSYGVSTDRSAQSLGLLEFVSSIEKLHLNVTCKQCSGSKWSELSELLKTESNTDEVTKIATQILALGTKLAEGEVLSVSIDRALNEAPKKCPHSPQFIQNYTKEEYVPFEVVPSEGSTSFLVSLVLVCTGLLVAILVIHWIITSIVRRRHMKWVDNLNQQQIVLLCKHQKEQKEKETRINQSTVSMFLSSSIPLIVRVAMPITILGNIAFFLTGHFSLGASITILVSLGGQTLRSDNFFSFSMIQSIGQIWNAGGRALAMIIVLASVAWPYTKQLVSLTLWFTPTNLVSVSRRGSIFLWLDILAKWSMVDVFVLVVTIVCLKITIQSPGVAFLPDDFYQIDLLVVPKWGLYANMIAQLISQISSHFIIHYHRRIVEDAESRYLLSCNTDTDSEDQENPRPTSSVDGRPISSLTQQWNHDDKKTERLCTYAFRRIHRAESGNLIVRRYVNPLLVMLAVTVSVLVTVGCVLPLFSVNILGFVGVLVESGQRFQAADTGYSVFGVIQVLFEQANLTGSTTDYIGLGSLSVLVVGSVLVVPILQAIALIVQWFATLNQQQRHRLSVWTEILAAWQYVEVYVISIVIASWQLGPISEFIVNPYCKSLQNVFRQLVFYGMYKAEDAQCLKTDITVEPTFYILFVASLSLALLNIFVVQATMQYTNELNDVDAMVTVSNELHNDIVAKNGEFTKENIDVVPVQFTDRFRWTLCNYKNIVHQTSLMNGELNADNESFNSIQSNKYIPDDEAHEYGADGSHEIASA